MNGNHFAGIKTALPYLRRDRIHMDIASRDSYWGRYRSRKPCRIGRCFLDELSESPITTTILGPIVPLQHRRCHPVARSGASFHCSAFGAALTMIRHTRTDGRIRRNELILGRPVEGMPI